MRKVLGITALLLLAFGVALAQQDATQRDSDQSGMSPQSEQKSVSLRGCLSSSDDRFVLTTQDGKTVKVEGDAAIAIEFDRVPYMLLQFERHTFLKVDSVTHVSANCTSIQGWS